MKRLSLACCSDSDLHNIVQSMPNLCELSLFGSAITNNSLKNISKLDKIRKLDIALTSITNLHLLFDEHNFFEKYQNT
eukprot:TRINITY_DN9747_c0_g1_i1.p1 TRINITY_DN9747_c0_g1~~TRINITY_DN9747_c0_g1_i1.p1  ORF type:complete len:78 (-),score=7.02 TRINITY_DN9747_c0_g1_i1:279-512(-)